MLILSPIHLLFAGGPSAYSKTTANPNQTNYGANYTIFNRSFALDPGATIETIGVNSAHAGTMKVKIALRNSATSYTIVVDQTVSHGGAGWQDFTLSSPYVVPGSGTYYVGVYQNITTIASVSSQPRTYRNADSTGTDTSMTEDTASAPAVRVSGYL